MGENMNQQMSEQIEQLQQQQQKDRDEQIKKEVSEQIDLEREKMLTQMREQMKLEKESEAYRLERKMEEKDQELKNLQKNLDECNKMMQGMTIDLCEKSNECVRHTAKISTLEEELANASGGGGGSGSERSDVLVSFIQDFLTRLKSEVELDDAWDEQLRSWVLESPGKNPTSEIAKRFREILTEKVISLYALAAMHRDEKKTIEYQLERSFKTIERLEKEVKDGLDFGVLGSGGVGGPMSPTGTSSHIKLASENRELRGKIAELERLLEGSRKRDGGINQEVESMLMDFQAKYEKLELVAYQAHDELMRNKKYEVPLSQYIGAENSKPTETSSTNRQSTTSTTRYDVNSNTMAQSLEVSPSGVVHSSISVGNMSRVAPAIGGIATAMVGFRQPVFMRV